ncbi:allantoinase AllB [Salipaludibacillus sp. LMS25]|jgi:allantoinase|uniref:allantoinase AllB n=1 Tax=Salipaludibacillus sp. LMS25 TaxID=2924031 RepID=UPI0020D01C8C|nr:allantoinase AllB [Salipaludibacillus sp. LMS25]UTR13603.1 allantoinase AllB [Salipaludibacillus sp. LMS25]
MIHAIINGRVFDGADFTYKALLIKNGVIQSIVAPDCPEVTQAAILYDAKGAFVLPGFIDVHVHFNEPGRTVWEGFRTGSAGAAAGGITTVCDMPLNSHPSANNAGTLQLKEQSLHHQSFIDFALWGGMTADMSHNEKALQAMQDVGIIGFKGFLSESGISDFKRLDHHSLPQAMAFCGETNTILALHAELEDILTHYDLSQSGRKDAAAFLESRPVDAELEAVDIVLDYSAKYNTPLHIVHVSHPDVVERLFSAKKTGVNVSIETCPHYLLFTDEDFLREGPLLKSTPPLRDKDSVEGLWEKIHQGKIDIISSDHSPCPPAMKQRGINNIWQAWSGIQSVQFGIPAFISCALRRGFSLTDMLPLLTNNAAQRFPYLHEQGRIQPGKKANLTIYDPTIDTHVTSDDILFRHKYSPYVGREIKGAIKATFVNGQCVYKAEEGIVVDEPFGKNLASL